MTECGAVPVTVVGGYLGAGKTTLINELLAGGHGRRMTVVVNDFGAINIDASLISSRNGNTISLTNGCICCSVAGDLSTELRRLSRAEPVPEQIVVEASGVADPAKVANAVRGWSSMQLHRTVTLFDPVSLRTLSDDKFAGATVKRQLRHADLLLPARVDLVAPGQLGGVLAWLTSLMPDVGQRLGPLCREEQIAMLLDLSTMQPGSFDSADDMQLGAQLTTLHASSVFSSLTWSPARLLDEARLRSMLRALGHRVQRCKGWVRLEQGSGAYALVQHGPAGTQITKVAAVPLEQAALVLVYMTDQCSEDELKGLLQDCYSKSAGR